MKPHRRKKKETVTFREVSHNEEGKKRVEKTEANAHTTLDTLKYIERKLVHKGVQRMDRHPADGLPLARGPPKSGHDGKYTWEGPTMVVEEELDPAPAAIDKKDPNYVYDEATEEDGEVAELVVGEVEVPMAPEVKQGVARIEIDVDPHFT